MEVKKRGPKKGAAKKWSDRLKKIGEQAPPEDLMKIINQIEPPKERSQSL
jgi:hypothetical protein